MTLLPQIDVLTTNGKALAQACKEMEAVAHSYYHLRMIYGGMSLKGFSSVKVDQAKKCKDLEMENTLLKKLIEDLSLRKSSRETSKPC